MSFDKDDQLERDGFYRLDLEAFVKRAADWHLKRWPEAEIEHVVLKMTEEMGEVASAVNGLVGKNSTSGAGDIMEETADVFITAFTFLGRWFPDESISEAIDKKLSRLEDPNSGHRAAALA